MWIVRTQTSGEFWLIQTCFNLCSKGSFPVLWIGRASNRSRAGKMKMSQGRNDGSFDASKNGCWTQMMSFEEANCPITSLSHGEPGITSCFLSACVYVCVHVHTCTTYVHVRVCISWRAHVQRPKRTMVSSSAVCLIALRQSLVLHKPAVCFS